MWWWNSNQTNISHDLTNKLNNITATDLYDNIDSNILKNYEFSKLISVDDISKKFNINVNKNTALLPFIHNSYYFENKDSIKTPQDMLYLLGQTVFNQYVLIDNFDMKYAKHEVIKQSKLLIEKIDFGISDYILMSESCYNNKNFDITKINYMFIGL